MNVFIILGALIASAALYGAIAFWKAHEIKTVDDFFHIISSKKGALSIVAGNLTLGTGLVYLAGLAQKQALFALVAPIGVLVGYGLLARLVSILPISKATKQHDVLDFICRDSGGYVFYKLISFMIAATYLALIPLEIYISSTLFASLVASGNPEQMARVFAIAIFVVVVAYSAAGGLRGVVATDIFQLGFMCIMIVIMLGGAAYFASSNNDASISFWPEADLLSLAILTVSTFLTAVATQFYNIINVTVGSSFDSREQQFLYRRTGIILFTILVFLIAVGIFSAGVGKSDFGSIDILMKEFGAIDSGLGTLLVFLIVFGMVAVLISSVDSGFIAISHTAYEKVLGNSSHSKTGGRDLLKVRFLYVVGLNSIAAIPLFYVFQYKPDVIAFLVTAISPLTVSAPFIASAAFCTSKFGSSLLHRSPVSICVSLGVIAVWILSIFAMVMKLQNLGHFVVIAGAALGLVFFWADCRFSRKSGVMA